MACQKTGSTPSFASPSFFQEINQKGRVGEHGRSASLLHLQFASAKPVENLEVQDRALALGKKLFQIAESANGRSHHALDHLAVALPFASVGVQGSDGFVIQIDVLTHLACSMHALYRPRKRA